MQFILCEIFPLFVLNTFRCANDAWDDFLLRSEQVSSIASHTSIVCPSLAKRYWQIILGPISAARVQIKVFPLTHTPSAPRGIIG